MKLPYSERLRVTASLVPACAAAADIGCDHGYLGIRLLLQNRCRHVICSDLRPGPLSSAEENARRFGVHEEMTFVCADGLSGIRPGSAEVLIFAGMGGDLIRLLLDAAPWVKDPGLTLVLQPQSGVPDLREYLAAEGFRIFREVPLVDAGFLYAAMQVRFTGEKSVLSPGRRYVSEAMLRERNEAVLPYLDRMLRSAERSAESLRRTDSAPERLRLFEETARELQQMRDDYVNSSEHS